MPIFIPQESLSENELFKNDETDENYTFRLNEVLKSENEKLGEERRSRRGKAEGGEAPDFRQNLLAQRPTFSSIALPGPFYSLPQLTLCLVCYGYFQLFFFESQFREFRMIR